MCHKIGTIYNLVDRTFLCHTSCHVPDEGV